MVWDSVLLENTIGFFIYVRTIYSILLYEEHLLSQFRASCYLSPPLLDYVWGGVIAYICHPTPLPARRSTTPATSVVGLGPSWSFYYSWHPKVHKKRQTIGIFLNLPPAPIHRHPPILYRPFAKGAIEGSSPTTCCCCCCCCRRDILLTFLRVSHPSNFPQPSHVSEGSSQTKQFRDSLFEGDWLAFPGCSRSSIGRY